MTSRERILAAIDHRQPDKVPIDLGSTPSSGISATAYAKLRRYLQVEEGHTRVYDVVQQLAQPEDWALDRFGVDVVDLGRTFNTDTKDWYDMTLTSGERAQYPHWFKPDLASDGSWIVHHEDGTMIARMPEGSAFFDETCFPYEDAWPKDWSNLGKAMDKVLWSALVHSPWDNAGDSDFWKKLRSQTLRLRETSDRAIMVVVGCNLFEWGTFLRRIDNFLMDLLLEPEMVASLLDALMGLHLQNLEKVCNAVGDIADIVRFGDDLGTDNGPFMKPETYRELFKPRHKILCDYVKSHSNMRTFLHSCGSVDMLIPDLIDVGFDILNPVQTNAKNMEPEYLKNKYGKDITFWGGGIDTRNMLNLGTPIEIRKQVLKRLEIFSKDGGYVFNTVHNILPDVPPENIVAMFDAVKEFNGE